MLFGNQLNLYRASTGSRVVLVDYCKNSWCIRSFITATKVSAWGVRVIEIHYLDEKFTIMFDSKYLALLKSNPTSYVSNYFQNATLVVHLLALNGPGASWNPTKVQTNRPGEGKFDLTCTGYLATFSKAWDVGWFWYLPSVPRRDIHGEDCSPLSNKTAWHSAAGDSNRLGLFFTNSVVWSLWFHLSTVYKCDSYLPT